MPRCNDPDFSQIVRNNFLKKSGAFARGISFIQKDN